MVIEEAIHGGDFAARDVGPVGTAVVAILVAHERVGMFIKRLPHFRMLLQELLQLGMARDPLLVVDELGIFLQLLGDFGMAVEEAIHDAHFALGDSVAIPIAVAVVLSSLIALLLMHHRAGILLDVCAHFGMIL